MAMMTALPPPATPPSPPAPPRRHYSILHPLYLAFSSASLYQDVARNWRGLALRYLLLLLALAWLPPVVRLHLILARFAREEAPAYLEQVPSLTVKRGVVSIDRPEPYFIRNPRTGRALVIIDTTGEHQSLQGTDALVLITRNRVMVARGAGETQTSSLAHVEDFHVDQGLATQWLSIIVRWAAIVLYPLLLLVSYAYRILQALVYALIGMLFARSLRVPLEYPALVRLSVMAVTPAIVLDTVLGVVGNPIPWWWAFCFVIAMFYLYFGIRANSPSPRTTTTAGSNEPPHFRWP